MRHAFHQAGEVKLHVAEAGEGEPLLMLHGWPQHWYAWRHLIPPLAQRYRVICPDLRGFGWSEAPSRGYDKETMMRDVVALLDELGVERVRLVGHDWGGWIGFLMCLLAPERVERFVSLNITPPFARANVAALATTWRLWYQFLISIPGIGAAAIRRIPERAKAMQTWMGVRSWDAETRDVFFAQFAEPARVNASVQLYRTFQLQELPRVLAGRYRTTRLRTPTLMLHGVHDAVVTPAQFAGCERDADDMTIELVPRCGHYPADDRPELVLDRALTFFA
ncbi:MAG TPA: alpha/beta hydrolase [Kofleriaceae bacterium]|nr:alpha/beta hydrolase [Kofleriaceae bacterium]